MQIDVLRKKLVAFPRNSYSFLPTPLRHLPNLSKALGGPEIWIKREDLAGPADGGNKTRKLEFLLPEAVSMGCDTLITAGAIQSNQGRQVAGVANIAGLKCHLVLRMPEFKKDPEYTHGGNALLSQLLGATIHRVPYDCDRNKFMEKIGQKVRSQGGSPYIVPVGASTPLGTLGMVDCAVEIFEQSQELGLSFDHVVLPTGSGGTLAGFLLGFAALSPATRVWGVDVLSEQERSYEQAWKQTKAAADLLGLPCPNQEGVNILGGFSGESLAQMSSEAREAILLVARTESLFLDPTYTGTAMAGLIHKIQTKQIGAEETVVFVHTGGYPALFAYRSFFDDSVSDMANKTGQESAS